MVSVAPRRVTVLGATGSIGCNTVDLLKRNPSGIEVEALTANRNVARLAEQARLLKAKTAVVADESAYSDLKEELFGTQIEPAAGDAAVVEAAARPVDWTMSAIVGAAGLRPTMAAIENGGILALANKETLVCGGELVMAAVERHGVEMIPVDSEHSAIFQVFEAEAPEAAEKIILTASGGPFRQWSAEEMEDVTPDQAVAHPNWAMGAKISVDSATMFNKGLELIEAHHLFSMPEERIDILIHPQSVIHSMVSYVDGSTLAQMGTPDMRTPIAYALGWPNRMPAPSPRLDFSNVARLTFEAPDSLRFPSLDLARTALRNGGGGPIVLNAANEVAVAAFLSHRIRFTDIARVVSATLEATDPSSPVMLTDVLALDGEGRRVAEEKLSVFERS